MLRRDVLIEDIVGKYMREQGFEIITDKKTYWEWSKEMLGEIEKVTILDQDKLIQLFFGTGMEGYVFGADLLQKINNPRTQKEQWDYSRCEENLQELYIDILKDMQDIIEQNCKTVLAELAEMKKKHLPNRNHFVVYRDNFEKFAKDYLQKYNVENARIEVIFETIMTQISLLTGEQVEEVEMDLIGLAAMFEKSIIKRYGGVREVYENDNAILLVDVGKQKKVFNFLLLVFHLWKEPAFYSCYRADFMSWYNREEM